VRSWRIGFALRIARLRWVHTSRSDASGLEAAGTEALLKHVLRPAVAQDRGDAVARPDS